ncbi:MAG: Unknown protein [uncultured Sulfurovum sp.]|uniref:Uncharacterized protein n=1 Tax=uncultured Sulfurovum sp. TaxID=269237 RepID=A0A6S6SG40_9BACT|nr:MAG: Unknown protein [uncultured Sulfurovum sp.]
MNRLTKGTIVTLIRERRTAFVNDIVIFKATVQSSGSKTIRFVGLGMDFCPKDVAPTMEQLSKKMSLGVYIAPNEEFIQRFIQRSEDLRLNGLKRAEINLSTNPNSRRFNRHKKLFIEAKNIVDLRDGKSPNTRV